MKLRLLFVLSSSILILPAASRRALADPPPVNIQIVEDEDEDFFSDHAPPKKKPPPKDSKEEPPPKAPAEEPGPPKPEQKKPEPEPKGGFGFGEHGLEFVPDKAPPAPVPPVGTGAPSGPASGVKKNAADAFDDLEGMERARGLPVPNKQAPGQEVLPSRPADQEARKKQSALGDPRIAPPPPPSHATPGAHAAPAPRAEGGATTARTNPSGRGAWYDWWHRSSRLRTGDIMFLFSIGAHPGQAYYGLGFEGMFADWGGLRLTVDAGYSDHSHGDADQTPGELGFFTRRNNNPMTDLVNFDRAFQHKEELSLTLHARSHGTFDLYTAFGLSHSGYEIRSSDQSERGGSGYFRAGVGLNWFIRRFFLGVDLGWYPIEIFRYRIDRTGPHNTDEVKWKDVPQAWDAGRLTFALHTGLSF